MTPRRAFSLIEAVLAVLVLGLSATMVAMAFGAVERAAARDEVRLEATEVAHRVILNYLRDPGSLPDSSKPLEQGRNLYRYLLSEEMLIEETRRDGVSIRIPKPASQLTTNEKLGAGLIMVTVRVYPHTGRAIADTGPPLATLTRIFNPIGSGDEDVLLRHVERLLGIELPMAPR